ncbi:MAG: 2-hydroxyacyl-CoA dehydratase [Promethearchaeota archaeon]
MVDDIFGGIPTFIQLVVEFINGREKLKKLKLRKHKHLIGMVFPTPELIFAAEAYPVFPIRMQKFNLPIINTIDIASKLTGWNIFSKTIGILKKFDSNGHFFADILEDIMDKVYQRYNNMSDLGEELGVTSDSCFGLRTITGMLAKKGKNLSGNLNLSLRCSSWQKFQESSQKFVKPGLWVNVPLKRTKKGMEMLIQDLNNSIEELEKITGSSVTNNSMRKICETTNKCKEYSKKIIHDIALSDTYPCHPVTLAQFLGLIEITFQDYLSDAGLFEEILKNMYQEMTNRKRKSEFAVDVSDRPKVLLVPRFGGYDPISDEYVYNNGGRMIYADWEILGYLKKIRTSGDMIENYADYLMDTISITGVYNGDHADRIHDFAVENNIDAVISNLLFGCHSLTSSFSVLRRRLIQSDIPSTLVNFNKIGENRQQLKTRIDALMEMI